MLIEYKDIQKLIEDNSEKFVISTAKKHDCYNPSLNIGNMQGFVDGTAHTGTIINSNSIANTDKNSNVETATGFLKDGVDILNARASLRDSVEGERTAAKIAATFNALTGNNLTESDAWTFLLIMKLVRSRGGKYHRDDFLDLACYSSLLGESESRAQSLKDKNATA